MHDSNLLIILFLILTLASLITSLIFSCLKHEKRHSFDIFNSIQNDINKKPIFSISKAPCEGNEKSPLIIDKFPGTIRGCDCIGRRSYRIRHHDRNRIVRHRCTRNETRAGCDDIIPIDNRDLYKWDGVTFCVNYNDYNYEYYLNSSVGEGENCPSGFKKCGILDTLKNVMCIKENLNCPINKILINNDNTYSENNINFNTINLNDNKYLHYTNENYNGNILSNFKLSEGGFPCYNPMRYNTILPQYILLKNFDDFICIDEFNNSFYDERYEKLDSISKKELYDDNSLINSINKLPNYPEFSLYNDISLFVRNYFGINKHCLLSQEFKISDEIIQDFKNKHKISKNINIAYICFNVLCIILFFISYCCLLSDMENSSFCIFQGINCFFLLVSLILGILTIHYMKDINFSSTCFDEIMNTFIEKSKNEIHKEKLYCILLTSFCLGCLLLNIILILIQLNICDNCFRNNYGNVREDNIKNNDDTTQNQGNLDEDTFPLKGKLD